MMCSFQFYDVNDRRYKLMNFRQKLRLFSDIYFCMHFMTGMVREDFLTTYFGSTWSRPTNRIADTSAERGCQSKW